MKLCGSVNWCKVSWLIVFINLLLISDFAYSQNLPPVLSSGISNQHAVVNTSFSYTFSNTAFKDRNNDQLTYTASSNSWPDGISFNASQRRFSGAPSNEGSYAIKVTATDPSGKFAEYTFSIIVHPQGGTYAAFSMDEQMGCDAKYIQFENKSNNATSFEWNFGNGNSSPLPNPKANYIKPGEYTVTLKINNDPNLVYSDVIRIYPSPVPDIDKNITNGCEPFSVSLTSTGKPQVISSYYELDQPVGSITGGDEKYYYWYSEKFSGQPERFTETKTVNLNDLLNGKYTVALEVTDANGCSGISNLNNLFEIYDKPTAAFSFVKDDVCRPSNTTFTRESTIEGSLITGHKWLVNGVEEGTGETFNQNFTAGSYIVTLIETSEYGCISEPFIDTVLFNSANTADFNYSPSTTCLTEKTNFTSIVTSGISTYSWDFNNDGSIEETSANAEYTFLSPGSNPVNFTASFNDGCVIEKTKNVLVDNIIADFNYSYTGDCGNNITVNFTDKSTSSLASTISSREWYYRLTGASGWTHFSSQQNPVLNNLSAASYDINLITSGINGCSNSIIKTIILSGSTIDMTLSGAVDGCFPAGETNFLADFESPYDAASTYSWQFGDGNNASGSSASHTYGSIGSFNVTLAIQTVNGCNYSLTRNGAVQLVNQPVISNVILHQADLCYSTTVELEVDYPDGTDSLMFITPNGIIYENILGTPNHSFYYNFNSIGTYSIGVVAIDNNCSSPTYDVENIQINGPVASFTPLQTTFCNNPPYVAQFANNTLNNTTTIRYDWDFGDGNTASRVTSPSHQYNSTGNYTVTLTATDTISGCTDSHEENISIYSFDNTPGIIGSDITNGCAPLEVRFTQNIADRLSGNYIISSCEWDFNGDNIIDTITNSTSVTYKYTTPGLYSVGLKVIGESGCDYNFSEQNFIRVNGPIVQFDLSSAACSETAISFDDNSTKASGDIGVPKSYLWTFGDGQFSSVMGDVSHVYSKDTIYTVSLKVTDSNNCESTLEKENLINIEPFTAEFTVGQTNVCSGSYINFTNLSMGNSLTYRWDFNNDNVTDITTSSNDIVSYVYNQSGDFSPRLTVTTSNNCSKTFSLNIHVINATAGFSAAETNIGCAPAIASFAPIADENDVTSYLWDFGDGITSNDRFPNHKYFTPGYYNVSLSLSFTGGCERDTTINDYIYVQGAYGELTYDGSPSCAPNQVNLVITNMRSVDNIKWDFGNGDGTSYPIVGNPTSDTIIYNYIQSGYTRPSVVLTSNECANNYTYGKISQGVNDPLEIYTSLPPKAEIWMDHSTICQGIDIQFRDSSEVRDALYPASEWKWVFSSTMPASDFSNEQNPVYAYISPGYHYPKLVISNELGCSDSTVSMATIKDIDNITTDFDASDYLVCPDDPIEFNGTSSSLNGPIEKWQWDFGDEGISSTEDAIHSFGDASRGKSLNVLFIATDNVLCSDSTTRTVDINNLQAALGYNPQHVYRGDLVDFEDLSTSDFNTTVNARSWNFQGGDPGSSIKKKPTDISFNTISNGNDISLTVTNSNGCSSTVAVDLDVLNNPPVLTQFSLSILRNTIYSFNFSDFNINFDAADPGQSLREIRIVDTPTIGQLTFNGSVVSSGQIINASEIGHLKYTSSNEGNGYFTWNASDGIGYSVDNAIVDLEILKEPDPPTLNDLVFNISEDSVLTFALDTFTDKNYFNNNSFPGFLLDSLQVKSLPKGQFTYNGSPVYAGQEFSSDQIASGYFTLTPEEGFEGTTSFIWNGFDGLKWGEGRQAKVIINYVNAPPVLTAIIKEDIPEDQEQIFTGDDFMIHYKDRDKNDVPEFFYLEIPSGTRGSFRINNTLAVAGLNQIAFQDLVNVRYIPARGGNDFINVNWGISDGQDTTFALLSFNYVNQPPVSHIVDTMVYEDNSLRFAQITFSKKYPDGPFEDNDKWDALDSIQIISLPNNGVLSYFANPIEAPYSQGRNLISNLRYTPSANWSGRDSFQYKAFDATEWSDNQSWVFITVEPINDPPVAVTDTFIIKEDIVLKNVSVKNNDSDIDNEWSELTTTISENGTAGANGEIDLKTDGNLTFTPNKDATGIFWFKYKICDKDTCSFGLVYIDISPLNDAPFAVRDENSMYETADSLVSTSASNLLSNDYDIDGGDTLSVLHVNGRPGRIIYGKYGDLYWKNDGSYIYYNDHLKTDFLKEGDSVFDKFTYTLTDNHFETDIDSLVIKIIGVNDSPVAVNDTIMINEDDISGIFVQSVNGLLYNDIDVDNDKKYVLSVNGSETKSFNSKYGNIVWAEDGLLIFTLNKDSVDFLKDGDVLTEEFPYVMMDRPEKTNPHCKRDSAKVVIIINGENDNPVANDDFIRINEDTETVSGKTEDLTSILSNDTDIDGSELSIFKIEDSEENVITRKYGNFEWNYYGEHTFYTNREVTDKLAYGDTVYQTFEYIVADLYGGLDTAKLEIEIIGVNDPPKAQEDLYVTDDVKSIIINKADTTDILDNDVDVDGIEMSLQSVNKNFNDTVVGKFGTLIWKVDGSFEYQPDSTSAVNLRPGEETTDEFSYIVKDEWDGKDTSLINITIRGINNAPIAKNDTLIVYEDDLSKELSGLGLLKLQNVNDPDKDTLLVSSVENSTEQVIKGVYGELFWRSDGTAVYTPNQNIIHQLGPNQKETEWFSYVVSDRELESRPADLVVILIGMNDQIYARNDTVEVLEDHYIKVDVVKNDWDPDYYNDGNYDFNSLTIIKAPVSGKAYVNSANGVITYSPFKDFYGKDSLQYKICDLGDPIYCDDAWMIIDVIRVNDKPIATPLVLETPINTPVSFNALNQVKDIDDGIDPTSIEPPIVENIVLSGNTITYTPKKDFIGKTEFIYSVRDYSKESAYVVVTVIVKDSLSNYQAVDDYVTTKEDISIDVAILENDTIGGESPDPRTAEITVFPENGTASYDWENQVLTYKPDKDFHGSDILTYIVSSGPGNWSSAKVQITVESVNDSLDARDDAAETKSNTPVQIAIFENDIDGDNGIDFTSAKFSKAVAYNDESGIVTYTPAIGFTGWYTFTYSVCDKDYINTLCDSATVRILVSPKSTEFIARNDTFSTVENIESFVLDNPHAPWFNDKNKTDPDNILVNPSSFTVIEGPQHGTYTINPQTHLLTYIPEENYFMNDWITYSIYDDDVNSDIAEINIWVADVNTSPVALEDNYVVSKNDYKRLYILENDYDTDGELDWSTLDSVNGPKLGLIKIDRNTGTILYKPEVNSGEDSFTYKICDNEGACTTAKVNISVELDTSIFIYITTYEDVEVTKDVVSEMAKYNLKFKISDIEEKETSKLGEWSFINENINLLYTPYPDSNGTDYFRLNVCSNTGECADLKVYVKIIPVNDPPIAVNDTVIWNDQTNITVVTFSYILKNDYDIDSDSIFLTTRDFGHGDSIHVAFNKSDSTITLTADTIFWCDAWFNYEIIDGEGARDTGTVFIFPDPESYELIAIDDHVNVDENSQNNLIDILNNDIFIDNQRCTIDTVLILNYPDYGIASATNDNFINYSPDRHYYGPDSLEYQIIDIWGKTDSAWVYIEVIEKNQPPVAVDDTTHSEFGVVISIPVLQNDYDPDALDLSGSKGDPDAHIDSIKTHIVIGAEPTYGTIYFDTDTYNFIYTPNIESCEDDEFEYTIYDNEGASATAKVTIAMPDEAPLFAIPDTVRTYPGIPVEVEPLLNDSGYFVPYIADYTNTFNGSVSVDANNAVYYTPNSDFVGRDSILYTIVSPCENSGRAYIIFLVEELRVPEIITPNGDDKNDVLIIDGIELFPDNMLQIYNRYGHIVYSKKTYDNTWGGYSNKGSLFGDKPLPAATYYYTLIYNGGKNKQAGIIYIFW